MSTRSLLLAILVYVTLDLSLPGMPGAFVFDAEDCAESVQGRARGAGVVMAAVPMARPEMPSAAERASGPRGSPRPLVVRTPRPSPRLPRAALAPAAPSADDPH